MSHRTEPGVLCEGDAVGVGRVSRVEALGEPVVLNRASGEDIPVSPTCSRISSSEALFARPPPTSWVSCCWCLFLEFRPKSVKLSPRPSLTPDSLHREALMGVQNKTSDCMGLGTRTEELALWEGQSS